MAMAITFDTLKFVKKLTEAGIPQKQAEAQAEAFKEAHEENIDSLATKQDLLVTKQELKQDMQELKQDMQKLKQELKQDMQELKIDLIKWTLSIVFTVSTAQAAIMLSIIKFTH